MAVSKYLKPTSQELKAFRAVLTLARRAGFRVPKVKLRIAHWIKGAHGYACGNVVVIERHSFNIELLCHEIAHVIANQVLAREAADHGRFWALIYGVLYQQCIQK